MFNQAQDSIIFLKPQSMILFLMIAQSCLGGEFYPIYDGLHRCTSLSCTSAWISDTYFEGQAFYCTKPPLMNLVLDSTMSNISSITLNSSLLGYTSELSAKFLYGLNYISFDLYFIGNWQNGQVVLDMGSITKTIYYSTTTLSFSKSLCDSTFYTVRTYTFDLGPFNLYPNFKIISYGGRAVVRNFHIYFQKCYHLCRTCFGILPNQCLTCLNGQAAINNQCPVCSISYPYMFRDMCYRNCDITRIPDKDKICLPKFYYQAYYITYLGNRYNFDQAANKMIILYDKRRPVRVYPFYFDSCYNTNFGPFTGSEGLQQIVQINNPQSTVIHIRFIFIIYNGLQVGSSINFFVDNQYYGSIFKIGNTLNSVGAIISTEYSKSYSSVNNNYNQCITTIVVLCIPKFPNTNVFIKILGDLKQPALEAWSLESITGYAMGCPNCLSCSSISIDCFECMAGFVLYQGKCYKYATCTPEFLKANNLCYVPTAVSQFNFQSIIDASYFLREYFNFSPYPVDTEVFDLVSQNGLNFQKGNIYSSYTIEKRIFGGPYVWADAVFEKYHAISKPHFKITLAFTIIFGELFTDGLFTYQIESNINVQITMSQCNMTRNVWDSSAVEYFYQVIEEFPHTSNTLYIQVSCSGVNNNIVDAYCGLFDYFIILHECNPFCLECTDSNTCITPDSSYDPQLHILDSSNCVPGTYYEGRQFTCINCPFDCLTCLDEFYCFDCISNLNYFQGQCSCLLNQYKDYSQVDICRDCINNCQNCLSDTVCTGCDVAAKRVLTNGQCLCFEGYYETTLATCELCFKYCRTCTGPTVVECTQCFNNLIVENAQCKCPAGWYFHPNKGSCEQCHSNCQECWGSDKFQCLQCDDLTEFRMLQGFKCVCLVGYYEDLMKNCVPCPSLETPGFPQCYKSCGSQVFIWHSSNCSILGCTVQSYGSCMPICGDGIVEGYEECDDQNNVMYDGCHQCTNMDTRLAPINRNLECTPTCSLCYHGYCYQCEVPNHFINPQTLECVYYCNDKVVAGSEQCDDNNTQLYDGCYNCKLSCSLNCQSCNNQGQCQSCQKGYQFLIFNRSCQPICGDGIIVAEEDCDDQNFDINDGCHGCRYFCDPNCLLCMRGDCLICNLYYSLDETKKCLFSYLNPEFQISIPSKPEYMRIWSNENLGCFEYAGTNCKRCNNQEFGLTNILGTCEPVCGDAVSTLPEECDDINGLDCNHQCGMRCVQNCEICQSGNCERCLEGFEFNLARQCLPVCGNQIISLPYEQCEDQNDIPYDGCFQCQYQCEKQCLSCGKGICLMCQHGYYLEEKERICKTLCGDGIIVGKEECDDQNLNQGDGCFACQLECDENCQFCVKGICVQCYNYWKLEKNRCLPVCGNNVVQYPYEQCEDGNLTQYDGCYNCMFDCNELCYECEKNQCLSCRFGYRLFGNQCKTFCGDGIKMGDEQCDDENDLPEDGCHHCKYDCPKLCYDCTHGVCNQCLFGYSLLQNACKPVCGDGIYIPDVEECDDGNNIFQDGCSGECKIEQNWQCNQDSLGISTCVYYERPRMQLLLLPSNSQNQLAKLKIIGNLRPKSQEAAELIEAVILNVSKPGYQISFQPNFILNADGLQEIEILIFIQFEVSTQKPILQVKIQPGKIQTEQGYYFEDKNFLTLSSVELLSQIEVQNVNQAVNFGSYLVNSLVMLGVLTFLLGDMNILLNLFDLLQLLTYLKYVNVEFPSNLSEFFSLFQYFETEKMCTMIKINVIFSYSDDGQCMPSVRTTNRFQQDSVNALFMENIIMFFTTLGMMKLMFTTFSILLKTFKRKISFIKMSRHEKIKIFILKSFIQMEYSIRNQSKLYYELFVSNYYGIIMAIFLQTYYASNDDFFIIINSAMAYMLLFYVLLLNLDSMQQITLCTLSKSEKNFRLKKKEAYQINFKSFWSRFYYPLTTVKKTCFIFFIVFLQNYPLVQLLCLIALSKFYLVYLIIFQPLFENEQRKQQLIEFFILLSLYLYLLLFATELFHFTFAQRKILGWIIIIIYSLLLGGTLILDLSVQITKFLSIMKARCNFNNNRPFRQFSTQTFMGDFFM